MATLVDEPRDLPLTFDPAFGKLGREIERFANHTKRLVTASQRHRAALQAAAEWSEGTAPLDRRPESVYAAMRAIDDYARHRRDDRATLVGAYFAHHHLRNQAELARQLLRDALGTDPRRRFSACHRAYAAAEADRTEWISALLELVISASAPGLSSEEYAALNVGSLTDHEDVDLAIVVSSPEAKAHLARGFAYVSKAFVRFASKIQLFLTEQLSVASAGATVEEYAELLTRPGEKVVASTQLLVAHLLAGSPELERRLKEEVTDQFYAGRGSPFVHESYLRAAVGELKHYLLQTPVPGVLSPKKEVYLPTKLVIASMRLIHGVYEPRPLRALELLALEDPEHAAEYRTLAHTFVQNEVLRALLFLYVSPSDVLDVSDEVVRSCSRRVSVLLGLGASARRSSEVRLAGAYADLRAQTLGSISVLTQAIVQHLGRVSNLRRLLSDEEHLENTRGNLFIRLLDTIESNPGGVFWDEIVELVGSTPEVGRRFVRDLEALDPARRGMVVRRWVELMCEDSAALLDLLVFIAAEPEGRAHAPLFWYALMERLSWSPGLLDQFVARLDAEDRSESLHRLANAYPPRAIAELADLVSLGRDRPRAWRVARALRSVLVLVHHSSNAVGRLATRVLTRTPQLLERLGDPRRMKDLSRELLAQSARALVPKEQVELLGDAFDVAALRGALGAVLDAAPLTRDADLIPSVDLYVRELFKACFREVHARSPMFEHYRPGSGIAVFATGGWGRSEAFGADWDYLAVVETDDRGLKKFFGKVLQRVAAEMARRGLPSHNRFTAHFNACVASLPELRAYFSDRTPETFIDEAEVLEARFFLGDPAVARSFQEQVASRVTSTNGPVFVRDVLGELADRRNHPPRELDVKLSPGGLREIQLLWLALRVVAEIPGPPVRALLPLAERTLPGRASDLRFLMGAYELLRRIRDIYRLVVAIDDRLDAQRFVEIAADLPPLRAAGVRPGFAERVARLMDRARVRIDRVCEALAARANGPRHT